MLNRERLEALALKGILPKDDFTALISSCSNEDKHYAAELARAKVREYYGNKVFFRGIVELSNYCRNNCLYCGIRRDNKHAARYRLSEEEILACCGYAYSLGFRTFVLQGGEDAFFTKSLIVPLIKKIKGRYVDCALTLSLGEMERDDYQKLFDAGADRYLLRHETAVPSHYTQLHPSDMSWEHRKRCLFDLKEIGFQAGAGMMVGSPYQKPEYIAEDLLFMYELKPQMIGIGPFIPHKDTPFASFKAGRADDTLFLLSVIRLMLPNVLLPATTALGTIKPGGREEGILAGANVIMPNISPADARRKYLLYDNKLGSKGEGIEEMVSEIRRHLSDIGYEAVADRGDYREEKLA